jgi:hypothetical protein
LYRDMAQTGFEGHDETGNNALDLLSHVASSMGDIYDAIISVERAIGYDDKELVEGVGGICDELRNTRKLMLRMAMAMERRNELEELELKAKGRHVGKKQCIADDEDWDFGP